jgi:hypothetical protein
MKTELNVATYFQIFKIRMLELQKKNRNKILDVVTDEYYKRVKSQYKQLYTLASAKITKSDKII